METVGRTYGHKQIFDIRWKSIRLDSIVLELTADRRPTLYLRRDMPRSRLLGTMSCCSLKEKQMGNRQNLNLIICMCIK